MELAALKKHNRKIVDAILAEKSTAKRAKMVKNLWLRLNPRTQLPDGSYTTARLQNMLVEESVKRRKAMWQKANPGKIIKGDRGKYGQQVAYQVPGDLLQLLELFNRDMFEGSGDEQKKNFRKVMAGLPEYQIPDRNV